MATRYQEGIGWGDMKNLLFDYVNSHLMSYREQYYKLLEAPDHVEKVLKSGAERAREISVPFMARVREAIGIRRLG